MPLIKKTAPVGSGMRLLLTNGRFPVSLDLSRQLTAAGHIVFTVDPMKYHVCKFSRHTEGDRVVPVPAEDSIGFIEAVKKVVLEEQIQMIIPMHEEIFYLAQDSELSEILFAPSFDQLLTLHNKWQFSQKMVELGLDVPEAQLCKTVDDVRKLDLTKDWALKPTYGRATSGLHHLKAGEPLPEDLDVHAGNEHIAQVWMTGNMFCTYSVALAGVVKACCIYPVIDTIDGSSCVFFQSVEHPGIKSYIDQVAQKMNLTGQIAFDFIESEGRLVTIECNPRSTSGIHLFSKTNWLAEAFTNPTAPRRDAPIGEHRQLVPGMLMWQREHGKRKLFDHLKRLATSRDVIFAVRDPGPALMQPFLAMSYMKRCREKDLELAKMFQTDLVWLPGPHDIANRKQHSNGMNLSRVFRGYNSAVGGDAAYNQAVRETFEYSQQTAGAGEIDPVHNNALGERFIYNQTVTEVHNYNQATKDAPLYNYPAVTPKCTVNEITHMYNQAADPAALQFGASRGRIYNDDVEDKRDLGAIYGVTYTNYNRQNTRSI